MSATKYYVTSSTGAFIRWASDLTGLPIVGQIAVVTGNVGRDWIYVGPGATADLSGFGGGHDRVYFTGELAEYEQSIMGNTYVFSRTINGRLESVTIGIQGHTDTLVFADGAVEINSDLLFLSDTYQYRQIANTDLDDSLTTPALTEIANPDADAAPIQVYITDANGQHIPQVGVGSRLQVIGNTGVDSVYVGPGSTVDATALGSGKDIIYLSGRLTDYSQSISGNTYTLTRVLAGDEVETVIFTVQGHVDRLVFADGFIDISSSTHFDGNTYQYRLLTMADLDASVVTPGTEPEVDELVSASLAPVISGTTGSGRSLQNGETLSVEINDAVYTLTEAPGGKWSVDLAVATPDSGTTLTPLVNGESYDVTVVFTDAAGVVHRDTSSNELTILVAKGFAIDGQDAGDQSGRSVSSAGDVNGDGLADLIIGALSADPSGLNGAGKSYVVFGKADGATLALADIERGIGGFAITGQASRDWSGASVSAAGDVNGDGLDDLIVGADGADPSSEGGAGKSYVIFGKVNGDAVDLNAVASGAVDAGGFVINGQAAGDGSGWSVSGAGDVNGDGLDDLIIGAHNASPGELVTAGKSYVVFGKTDTAAIDLDSVAPAVGSGTGGFVINGQQPGDQSGISVSSAGDVNGDGLDDVIVGAPGASLHLRSGAGKSYVVFGKENGAAVALSSIASGFGGFVINGEAAFDRSGHSVSSAGDVNGDGLDDLLIGAYGASPSGKSAAGRSYVVFGKGSGLTIELADVRQGIGGFVINGEDTGAWSGYSLSSAGDVNGDGLDDLIVGAAKADPLSGDGAGKSYVVFGKAEGTPVELSAISTGTGGFVINGEATGDGSGFSVSAAGDVDGDGLDDLLVGAYQADPSGISNAGRSYVVFGKTDTAAVNLADVANNGNAARRAIDYLGDAGDNVLTGTSAGELFVAGAGDDTLIGSGGADIFNAGAGDDVIVINGANAAALHTAAPDGLLSRISGGTGKDTLRFGEALALDLSVIANNRLSGIEIIDLDNLGGALTLSSNDVLNIVGSEATNDLRIDGGSSDVLTLFSSGFSDSGVTETIEGVSYSVYLNTELHLSTRLLVASDIQVVKAGAPGLISDARQYGGSGIGEGAGFHSLLDDDADNWLGQESHWAGNGRFNQAVSLTYSFVEIGGLIRPGFRGSTESDNELSLREQQFFATAFASFAAVANVIFTQVDNTPGLTGGGDIRISKSSASVLNAGASTLAFAYQPFDHLGLTPLQSTAAESSSAIGDVFLVSNAMPRDAFLTEYGIEKWVVLHELGHALGLDHPFNDNGGRSAGFYGYTDDNGGVNYGGDALAENYTGQQTGGGHQTPLTDTVSETLLTYHNPYDRYNDITIDFGPRVGDVVIHAKPNAPWSLGIQDVAALQHLYGANLNTASTDTVYTFSSDQQVWQTLWDTGGHDVIEHQGSFNAVINLNEGTTSHLGFHGGTSYILTAADFGAGRSFASATLAEASDALVEISDDGATLTYTYNQAPGGIDDDFRLDFAFDNGSTFFIDISNIAPIDRNYITGNVGIAYGVVIEDARGGDGDDVLIGNFAANQLAGGRGNDTYTGGEGLDTFVIEQAFGQDRILDFAQGQDTIVFADFGSSDIVVTELGGNTLFSDGLGNSVLVENAIGLTAGQDYVYGLG